jgi:polysaccharide deacetylase 2 family uncharacterized protein YibQ
VHSLPDKKANGSPQPGDSQSPPSRLAQRAPARVAVPFVLLLPLILALTGGGCQGSRRQPLSESERRELAGRFLDSIANVGGSQVRIKRPAGPHHGQGADPSLQVLATSGVYPSILSALQHESEKNGLELREIPGSVGGGPRAIDLYLTRRGQRVCRIHLREVPRLLRAAIVMDDLGQTSEAARKLLTLPYPLTFSVLPHLRYSEATAEEIHHAGRQVMLHLPMEAEPGSHVSPGEGAIRTGLSDAEVHRIIQDDLASVPFAAGVNNHMGSHATKSVPLMADVMRILAKRQLYFIDSRTTADSVALAAARRQGLPAFYRAVFLDDTETVSYTLGQLREFRRIVEEQGMALAIGHPHVTTIEALARFLPELERADIELVAASELVRLPEVARLHPPAKPGS